MKKDSYEKTRKGNDFKVILAFGGFLLLISPLNPFVEFKGKGGDEFLTNSSWLVLSVMSIAYWIIALQWIGDKKGKISTDDKTFQENSHTINDESTKKLTEGKFFYEECGFVYRVMHQDSFGNWIQLKINLGQNNGNTKRVNATRSMIRYYVPFEANEDVCAAKKIAEAYPYKIEGCANANANDIKLLGDDEGANIGWCAKK